MKGKILIGLAIFCFTVNFISGQTRPFPQPVNYPYGFIPSTIGSANALSAYNKIKSSYYRDCNGNLRLISENVNNTKVEGVGFGMLLSAYYGDKEYFDRQFEFYKSKRTTEAKNLMAWHVTCEGMIDRGNATDGDIDVAFSLIVAYNQWGGKYLNEAKNIIQIMKQWLIVSCGDTILALKPGVVFGGCHLTDIMYYTPAFFRIFAEVTGDTNWNTLANDAYRIRNASAHPVTGLVPDWQSVNGTPSANPSFIGYYRYDACRSPWRQALDYLWNGDTLAKDWCIKVSNWAYSIGPANIMDGYNLDGTPNNGGSHNSAFTGGFAVGAMCNSQDIVNSFGTAMALLDDNYWFNLYTRTLYLFTLTGNFWKPETHFVKAANIEVNGEGGIDSITVNRATLRMEAIITPDSVFDKTVEWSLTSGAGIARISEPGLLTPLKNGTVSVMGTAWDGSGVYGEKEILIKNQTVVNSLALFSATGVDSIKVNNDTLQILYKVSPADACDTSVTWKVDNTLLASVTSTGLLTAKKEGNVKVIATSVMIPSISDTLTIVLSGQPSTIIDNKFTNLVISPNPANDVIWLSGIEFSMYSSDYELIDINSSVIIKGQLTNSQNIIVSNLKPGIYFLKLLIGDASILKKVIIE